MLSWFELDSETVFRDFLISDRRDSEEERKFIYHLRRMESNVIFLLLGVAGLAIVAIWPTDWLIFEGRALEAFFRWRLSVLLIIAGAMLCMLLSSLIRQYAGFLVVSVMGLAAFVVSYIFGATFEEGFRTPFFYWTYVLPFVGCFILSLRLVPRVLATFIMVLPSFLGFLLADPAHLQYRYAASPFLVQLGVIPVALVAGHLVHNLYRRYYFLNRELEDSVKDKEFLFQELNHRVKNNLQVIMSLLKLRSNEIDDPDSREKFISLRRRIHAMAIVHEKLYQTGEYSKIDLREYFEDLIQGLVQSQGDHADEVTFELDVEGTPKVSLRQAVPLGLIVNELVSNALAHAFNGQEEPIVSVSFPQREDRNLLEISDNGEGFPGTPDFENSFGLNIVRTLVDRQLEGTIDFEQNSRTVFRISYPPNESNQERESSLGSEESG